MFENKSPAWITRRFWEGSSIAEIAGALNCSDEYVETTIRAVMVGMEIALLNLDTEG